MPSSLAIDMRGITKTFRNVRANDRIDLSVEQGSIHALVGENGAGKSTLMKILYGMYRPDAGTISIDGETCTFSTPQDAIGRGVAMVHQHFMLIPTMTVSENIILGSEPVTGLGRLDARKSRADIDKLASKFNLSIEPDALVSTLPVGLQQRVEILKVLYRRADILILDEPTAVLAPQEIEKLFDTLRTLRDDGATVIMITHKLQEVMSVSDHVTVLRNGRVVLACETATTDMATLSQAMVGREISARSRSSSPPSTEPLLSVDHISFVDRQPRPHLDDISFTLHRKEILGIAGVEGNGQSYLVDLLTGMRQPTSGTLRLHGHGSALSHIAHIPEDRHREGLVLDFTLAENAVLGRQREGQFSGPLKFRRRGIADFASTIIKQFGVHPPSMTQRARMFSGGNQQKIVLGRELTKKADLIIANQPCRGLDIGAMEFVQQLLLQQRDSGKGILLISADLSELLLLSDRIAVMFEGKLVTILDAGTCTEYDLGAHMTGASRRSA